MSFFKQIARFNDLIGNTQGNKSEPDWDVAVHQLQLIHEEYSELIEGVNNNDLLECRDAVADILVTVYGFAHRMGFDADLDLEEVHDSNMSKFCSTIEDAVATQEAYEEKGIQAAIEKISGIWAVKSHVDQTVKGKFYPKGKLLKSVKFFEPNLVNL